MDIERALAFMAACGIDLTAERRLHEVDVFTSHEGLLLDYEEGLTREDSLTGDWYDCSAHLLWVGERTRGVDDAHVEFFAGVHNPIGVKLGPAATPDDVVELCERLESAACAGAADVLRADGRRSRLAICCRRCCVRCATKVIRFCGRPTRCTRTRSARRAA